MKDIAVNRQAFFNYEILEKFEAGLVLKGAEVKSVREGRVNLRDSFGRVSGNEARLLNMHVSPYEKGGIWNAEPARSRKLLLKRAEIKRIAGKVSQKGLTLVPLRIYFKRNWAKVEIALAKSRKTHDKRERIKNRELDRDIQRAFKGKL